MRPSKILVLSIFVLLFTYCQSAFCATYPRDVQQALDKAGTNRAELEKVLEHYAGNPDAVLAYRAACFLIAQMPVHQSQSFYWADTLGQRLDYDEFAFPDFKAAVSRFNELSLGAKLHPVIVLEQDLNTLSATYLIQNIDKAFQLKDKPWARNLTFEQFCEYLLPYRVMNEPCGEWRDTFRKEFAPYCDTVSSTRVRAACQAMCTALKSWFFNTWVVSPDKVEPAYLSPSQILFRKQGACEDMANWGAYMFRSLGIATTIDYTPAWATSTGSHYWNVSIGEHGEFIPYVMGSADSPNRFYVHREPSKVLRLTYSAQKESLAQRIPMEQIPDGHLRNANCIDVTRDYWKVAPLSVTPDTMDAKKTVAYLCVLNGLSWRTVWWGALHKGVATFTDMSCGVVYLPMWYRDGALYPAASPYLLRKDGQAQVLTPDRSHLRTISLPQQEGYLIFRPSKKYVLYYWDYGWEMLGVKLARDAKPLTFSGVPSNALLLLLPEYSQGKERPFTIDQRGEREWW